MELSQTLTCFVEAHYTYNNSAKKISLFNGAQLTQVRKASRGVPTCPKVHSPLPGARIATQRSWF